MDDSRRKFLKVAGCAVFGAAWGVPVMRAVGKALTSEPAPGSLKGTRWALVIDSEKCMRPEVMRACQQACHVNHNVPDIGLPEEDIKWIWPEKFDAAFPDESHEFTADRLRDKDTLVLCNHCDHPPCARVCPTAATWKREDGIVMMDMHRCIGCRYCMAACPYGSRSFNWRDPRPFIKTGLKARFPSRTKGVVEKCNFCAERLALGKEPYCVEAANRVAGPGAMVFGDLGDKNSEVARTLRGHHSIRRKPGLGTRPQVFYLV